MYGLGIEMASIFKFLVYFLIYGAVWFGIFSISTNQNENIFIFITKTLQAVRFKEINEKTERPINSERVIDALTNAFKP